MSMKAMNDKQSGKILRVCCGMSEFLETMKSADSGHAWRVLDEFMDALKEAKPETYAGLMHDLKRTK